jgi:hypothetical protein
MPRITNILAALNSVEMMFRLQQKAKKHQLLQVSIFIRYGTAKMGLTGCPKTLVNS